MHVLKSFKEQLIKI
jgi:hypothetical protein